MNRYKYILYSILAGILLTACQKDDNQPAIYTGTELSFLPALTELGSPALRNGFFNEGNQIDIEITSRNTAGTTDTEYFTYKYHSDGIFRGDPDGYHFPIDDQYIAELVAIWPTKEVRDEYEVPIDQRNLENYQKADWLTAIATLEGLMPTETSVPLAFQHTNCMLEFQLTGQTSSTLNIETLVLELLIGDNKTAFWAYCNTDNGHAELILKYDTRINVSEGYMIGRTQVRDAQGSLASYTIIMPETDLILLPGHKYLITLSGKGYDLSASISIQGWGQTESGIGIPFQQPSPNDNNEYRINTPAQLVTASYLIRHYNENTTIPWHEVTYILKDNFEFSEEYLKYWIPIPQQLAGGVSFSGKFIQNNEEVEEIIYTAGVQQQTLRLYEE